MKLDSRFIDWSKGDQMSAISGDSFFRVDAATGQVTMSPDIRDALLEALGLLETYTDLQYVTSNNSYIITDVALDGNYKMTFKGRVVGSGGAAIMTPYTAHTSATMRQGLLVFNTSSHKISMYWPNVSWIDQSVPDYIDFASPFVIEQDRYGVTVTQGGEIWECSYDGSDAMDAAQLYIMGSANPNHTSYKNGEFHELTVEMHGNVIAHFVPKMRDSDGVAGIYDTVAQKFYVSSGGAFVAGPTK